MPQPTLLSETIRAIVRFKRAYISQDIESMATYIDAIPAGVLRASDYESLFTIIVTSQTSVFIKAQLLEKVLEKLWAIRGWDNLELKVGNDYYWFKFDSTCIATALAVLGKHSIRLGSILAELRRLHPENQIFNDCLHRYKKVLVATSKYNRRTDVYDVCEVANAWAFMTMSASGACLFYDKMPERQARALVDDFVAVDDFTRRHHGLEYSPIDLAAAQMNGTMLLRALQFMHASRINDAKYVTAFDKALRTYVAAQNYDLQFNGHDSAQQYKAAKIQDMLDHLQGFWFSTFETNLYKTLREAVAKQLQEEPWLLTEINVAKHKIPTPAKSKDNDATVSRPIFWSRPRVTAVMPG